MFFSKLLRDRFSPISVNNFLDSNKVFDSPWHHSCTSNGAESVNIFAILHINFRSFCLHYVTSYYDFHSRSKKNIKIGARNLSSYQIAADSAIYFAFFKSFIKLLKLCNFYKVIKKLCNFYKVIKKLCHFYKVL